MITAYCKNCGWEETRADGVSTYGVCPSCSGARLEHLNWDKTEAAKARKFLDGVKPKVHKDKMVDTGGAGRPSPYDLVPK